MADTTSIEWCDHTWSPWEGCQKVSPGCDHCYAEARNQRFAKGANWGPGAPRRRTVDWSKPERWNKQAAKSGQRLRVFPSLCDPFDNEVPDLWREELLGLIATTPHLDWLLLTKRVGNVSKMLKAEAWKHLPNVWLGSTVVNQEEADRDIPKLLAVPARVRFLSIEPMLGAIDLRHLNDGREIDEIDSLKPWTWEQEVEAWSGTAPEWEDDFEDWFGKKPAGLTGPMHERIDWVICGGESGPHARPMHPDWARSLRDQCAAASVPFLFKQWGEWAPEGLASRRMLIRADGTTRDMVAPYGIGMHAPRDGAAFVYRLGKKAAGRLLDGVLHNEFPRIATSTPEAA